MRFFIETPNKMHVLIISPNHIKSQLADKLPVEESQLGKRAQFNFLHELNCALSDKDHDQSPSSLTSNSLILYSIILKNAANVKQLLLLSKVYSFPVFSFIESTPISFGTPNNGLQPTLLRGGLAHEVRNALFDGSVEIADLSNLEVPDRLYCPTRSTALSNQLSSASHI